MTIPTEFLELSAKRQERWREDNAADKQIEEEKRDARDRLHDRQRAAARRGVVR